MCGIERLNSCQAKEAKKDEETNRSCLDCFSPSRCKIFVIPELFPHFESFFSAPGPAFKPWIRPCSKPSWKPDYRN